MLAKMRRLPPPRIAPAATATMVAPRPSLFDSGPSQPGGRVILSAWMVVLCGGARHPATNAGGGGVERWRWHGCVWGCVVGRGKREEKKRVDD